MCFNVHEHHERPYTRKENVNCWKILKRKDRFIGMPMYFSPIMLTRFIKGKILKTEIKFDGLTTIEEGYHSFSTKAAAYDFLRIHLSGENTSVHGGYIPAGSLFYYNPRSNQYVSDAICIP